MFKYLFFILFFLTSTAFCENISTENHENLDNSSIIETDSSPQITKSCHQGIKNLIEFKFGYFRAESKKFRDIYSDGVIYGVEGTFKFYKKLYGFLEGNYFPKSGKTLEGNTPTKIKMVYLGAGLKIIQPIFNTTNSFYLGIGALPSYLYINNKSEFLIKKVTKWDIGGIFKGGILIKIYRRIILDVFIDYKYLKMSFDDSPSDKLVFRNNANLSGITVGGAVGFCF